MESISFQLPHQHPPGADDFDTRPAAVAEWVAQLPMGNIGEAAKQVYQAIKQSNSLTLPLSERLELLEQLAEPLAVILATLRLHYAEGHFPLPERSLRTAAFSHELLRQVVMGYQAVLDGEEQRSWLFRLSHHRMWRVCVHRLLHYLGELLSSMRMIHRPYPAGVWLAVHKLYREVLEQGRAQDRVTLPWAGGASESLEEAYKRLLLTTLLEPRLFTMAQLEQIGTMMPLWLRHVQLDTVREADTESRGYCIRLDQDAPYTVSSELCENTEAADAESLLLAMTQLEQLLDTALAAPGEQLALPGSSLGLSREIAETLRQCWHVPQAQRQERQHSERTLQVVLGLSAISSVLRAEKTKSHAGITDQQMGDDLEPLMASKPSDRHKPLPMGREGSAVWDVIFAGTDVLPNAWAMQSEERRYAYASARELDYSEHGASLMFREDPMQMLDVGELVALNREGGVTQLFSIRWLQDSDESVLAGLMRLAVEVEPVLVVTEGESEARQETALWCLLGTGEDGRPQLFMPHLPSLREHSFSLVVERKKIPLVLQDRVALSPLFQAYHFAVTDRQGRRLLEEAADLVQTNRLLHAVVNSEPPPEKPRAADDFSDLWSSL